ncbi:PilW family protein [Caldimonas brevitalea]|uniref:Type IV fimbrial biogenesis protein PilW n=1 Tax=Caldimonas brevitalea TaxID=413882 RepID=A0A0G3BL82_9BURK|nr:PilW family protein [Caldimonas brevitalea]AKJ28136.1 type IV fimbrial biogenesis protein PilW [Caldimonas brevitalea]
MTQFHRSARAACMRGLSLVEVMISLVIGLIVVGAVLTTYLGVSGGSRYGVALAQISEDATLAMNLLRSQIAMAGYGRPYAVGGPGGNQMLKAYNGEVIRGCEGGFTDPAVAGGVGALTCVNNPALPDAIAIAYEADTSNTVGVGSPAVPSDCLGNGLTLVPPVGAAPGYFLAENRFYLDGAPPELHCKGSGGAPGTTAQPLVENVVDLQIKYGVATGTETRVAAKYVDPVTGIDPGLIVSVRVCIVVRSAANVMDAPTDYEGCNGTVTFPAGSTDRRMYRAFTSTIVLQNRLL